MGLRDGREGGSDDKEQSATEAAAEVRMREEVLRSPGRCWGALWCDGTADSRARWGLASCVRMRAHARAAATHARTQARAVQKEEFTLYLQLENIVTARRRGGEGSGTVEKFLQWSSRPESRPRALPLMMAMTRHPCTSCHNQRSPPGRGRASLK